MEALSAIDDRQRRVVECRDFGGLTIEETAQALGVSPATVKLDWSMARAWLFRRLGGKTKDEPGAPGEDPRALR